MTREALQCRACRRVWFSAVARAMAERNERCLACDGTLALVDLGRRETPTGPVQRDG